MVLKVRSLATFAALSLSALLACSNFVVKADDPGSTVGGDSQKIKDELTPETRKAVDKGLAWLARNVDQNGTINSQGGDSAAIMALAGIAFLAGGNIPNDGPYGEKTSVILDYVLKNCQNTGLISSPGYGEPMYGHGFATLFLAEAYGMTKREDIGEKLRNAVRLIVRTQQPNVGGWRYQPQPNDSDLSVTICQVMALRAARNAGIEVPNQTIQDALDYVKKSQCPDGGFMYTLGGGGSMYPRSAAGVACLYYMRSGNDFDGEIKKGIGYLKAHMPNGNLGARGGDEGNFYYGNYYATQAMFMYGGDAWEEYWPNIRKTLLARQGADGSWQGEAGPVYGTSMALIMLQVPNRLLPILQK